MRFGDHPDKTRMVIDLSDPAEYHYRLDNETGIMLVVVGGAQWDAGLNSRLMQHPLILGYRAQEDEKDTVLALKLKKEAKVRWKALLPPDGKKGYRLVMDLVG